ncbi:uncharacterized protein K02A2.6-like [Aedes albopictus]|uniref:RNA-directed DNA polymerase n=1 Tax=Aedes albopictus TaxID=7160 RepID=A0ABM1Y4U2_AEDAL
MSNQDLKDAILRLTELVASQQQQISLLNRAGQVNQPGSERIIETLATGIEDFYYDPDGGVFFDAWYARYEDVFKVDGKNLDDPAKVRLLLRKIGTKFHERYVNSILPKHPRDFGLDETVNKLKKLYGRQTSLFNDRYRCLQYIKNDADDFSSYAASVNKHCEAFQLSKLSDDQFKALRFVCGLQSSRDADIRTRLISKLEAEETAPPAEGTKLTLENLVEECHRFNNLKQDTKMIEKPVPEKSIVNAVSSKLAKKKKPKSPCWLCGDLHFVKECSYQDHFCGKCKRKGHKEGYCSTAETKSRPGRKFDKSKTKEYVKSKGISVKRIDLQGKRKFVTLGINGNQATLQLDCASDITIIATPTWEAIGKPAIEASEIAAISASGDRINIVGEFKAQLTIKNSTNEGIVYVSSNPDLNVLGIDTIELFDLWAVPFNSLVNAVHQKPQDTVEKLRLKFSEVFQSSLGKCTKAKVKLYLKPDARPVYCPKRPVAYAALPKVDAELQRLQDKGIISPVKFSDWATPIVVVRKSDNVSVRICGDYSTGLNNALESDGHPLPHPDDIFADLAGCRYFSQLDLSDAYLQVEVEEKSQKYLTINTHRGLFKYNRLPPGIKSAPGAFQRIIDSMVAGIPGVKPYLDDIMIAGRTKEEHDQRLNEVLERIKAYGFHLRMDKCRFGLSQIKFLGHIIDQDGLRPDPAKTSAISQMPAPKNVSQLRSYLGAINYYGRFVKQMKDLRAPMDYLLKKNVKWEWTDSCQKSFEKFKTLLKSDLLLTHFDPNKDIIVAGVASKDGVGAVIMHRFPNGSVKAISHVSRSLTAAEQNYGQIEKEALALVFAVTRFHKMLFGRKFILQTDHKPLLKVFGSKKGIPVYTANRLQRWALTLMLYNFDIQFVKTEEFGHADLLSRLMKCHERVDEEYVIASIQMEADVQAVLSDSTSSLPVTSEMIAAESSKDSALKSVMHHINEGWPEHSKEISDPAVQQFFTRRDSLQIVQGCIMFGDRVVVPVRFRKRILQQLHRGHPGMDRMKSLARSFVYWPKIDDDIEGLVRCCRSCAEAAKSPRKTDLESWPVPSKPWERVHIDYAGPIDGFYYFLVIDAFSKWPEIFRTRSTTTSATLDILQEIFARFGNPRTLVSDNGTQFVSARFKQFCDENGITHLTIAPYHPQSNGQAERFVDTLKRGLRKLREGGKTTTFQHLQTFLSVYRSTPNRSAPNGKSPAELFLGRTVSTPLDLLKPRRTTSVAVNDKQNEQFNRRHGTVKREFSADDLVYAQIHHRNVTTWVPGKIIERKGSVNYNVLLDNGRLIRSHTNQLRGRHLETHLENSFEDVDADHQLPWTMLLEEFNIPIPCSINRNDPIDEHPQNPVEVQQPTEELPPEDIQPEEMLPPLIEEDVPADNVEDTEPQPTNNPIRNRRLPSWLSPYDLF